MRTINWCVTGVAIMCASVSFGQGEVVTALSARPGVPEAYIKADVNTHFIYQFDTQSLPIVDDFSIDRTRKLWAMPTDPGVTLSATIYGLEVGGVSNFDMLFSDDTTFYYTIDPQDPPVTTRVPLPMVIVTLRDLSVYPPVETVVDGWPAYNVFDTLGSPTLDTIFQLTPALVQDSLLVYNVPPTGGNYIMNNTNTPLILWADDDVYINNTYAIDPPTIGVATFDGLSRTGYPYNFEQYSAYGIADHLTSVPIDLQYSPADSIYLSFYYQNQGFSGDNIVQPQDSLVVEFYAPNDDEWVRVWSKQYTALADFQQVFIPIIQDRFLKDGFRMRFLNYATLSGSFDHWHLDYVRLGAQRTYDDTSLVDVAYKYPANTLLNTYTSVPFSKYAQAPSIITAPSVELEQCNLYNVSAFITYGMQASLTDGSGAVNFANGTNVINNASSCFNSQHPINSSPNFFTYDTGLSSTDAAFWQMKFWTNATPDINRYNDTTTFVQELSNYYAYDDGSPEAGYNLATAGAKLALQYDLLGSDSLKAIRMYFNPAANPQGDTPPDDGIFLVTVWSSLSPEVILHQNYTFSAPQYRENGIGLFVEYPLDSTIYVDGTIYIGWVQTNNAKMYLGMDRNRDNSNKVYYKTGTSFASSSVLGSLMMRPVMVSETDPYVGVDEVQTPTDLLIYPNPASDHFTIRLAKDPCTGALVQCMDATGRMVLTQRWNCNSPISTTALSNGVYLVRVVDASGATIAQGRSLIQH